MTKIQEIREAKNMSVYELSKKSGIRISTITNIEKGISDLDGVRLGTLKKISKALGVPVNEIIE